MGTVECWIFVKSCGVREATLNRAYTSRQLSRYQSCLSWDYIGTMEKKMETIAYRDYTGFISGMYWGESFFCAPQVRGII